MINNKKGAIELSISTIVVIVLAMSMLILGLVLVRNIFQGSTDNVSEINNKVQDEVRKLFQEDTQKTTIRLTAETAKVTQGKEFGFAFGIKNTITGTPDQQTFRYHVDLADTPENLKASCGVSPQIALSWVRFGQGNDIKISPGEVYYDRIVLDAPTNAPLCTTKYNIIIEQLSNGGYVRYAQPYFFVQINSPGIFG